MTNEIFDIYGNDPIALCKTWLAEAEESELNDPEAVCLATADKEGHPSARMVLLKEIDLRQDALACVAAIRRHGIVPL